MAEVLHRSHRAAAGVQGALLDAGLAVHSVLPPREAAYPAWVPASPNPHLGFVVDAGARHKQAEAFVGAAAAAAIADQMGRAQRRTPEGVAAPYQKDAAQRAAEKAIRPWDPITGLGLRHGAPGLQLEGANAGPGAFARADAPSLYHAPGEMEANAYAAAAGRVARSGQGQGASVGAYSIQHGAPARELWPVNPTAPKKYCTACRGDHDEAKAHTSSWQPYTPAQRLTNLQLLDTKFRRAMAKGMLSCGLSDSYWDPVRWTAQPAAMSHEQFQKQLALAFDGVRDGHEPHRFLATQAAEALMDCPGRGPAVAEAAASLVAPLKLCLNTMQPQLVGGLVLLLSKLLRCHSSVGPALAPYFRHLLPALAVFKDHRALMELPAPTCLPPTGTFSGSGMPPNAGGRSCRVCGAPVDRDLDAVLARQAAESDLARNASKLGAEAAADPEGGLPAANAFKRLAGRTCGRYTLAGLIDGLLGLMVSTGGPVGRRLVQSYIPTFNYYCPADQPPCVTVEERWEAAQAAASQGAARRRPGSAPRASSAAAAGGRRPAAAAAPRPATAQVLVGGGSVRGGGGGGSGQQRRREGPGPWSRSTLSDWDLARWDGTEFQEEPLYDNRAVQSQQQQQQQAGHADHAAAHGSAGGAGGGSGRNAPQRQRGQVAGAEAASLRISTPVPVFDSPHDPLYRMLASDADAMLAVGRRSVSFKHAGPEATRKGGALRGGAGGAGGGGGKKVNVNAEVPYKASPSGVKRAW